MYFGTQEAVAIDTVPKETQEEAITGVLLHLRLILWDDTKAVDMFGQLFSQVQEYAGRIR